ncbi:hypothetical protein [Paenibacillus sp. FSL A5-0031]|uniref:hypothetical protein n=1 Tax=Paenibacillus sp. FSL A5-0031 TaxID=1920420 RepID=UPI00118478EB|nr:hypothetical protein [Paenibacillus sp. FSL A5-0031]
MYGRVMVTTIERGTKQEIWWLSRLLYGNCDCGVGEGVAVNRATRDVDVLCANNIMWNNNGGLLVVDD